MTKEASSFIVEIDSEENRNSWYTKDILDKSTEKH